MIGKRTIYTADDMNSLVGKKVFVSHGIRVSSITGRIKFVYRMHLLHEDLRKDAAIIRKAMCDSKIEMLRRIIDYPESPYHLSCQKGLFDYEIRINRAIEIIKHYPEVEPPDD